MSQENVDIVRRALDAFNQRPGLGSQDAYRGVAELLDPEVEWHDQRELPGATVHRGIDEVMRHLASAEESVHYEPIDLLEIRDAGACVVAVYRVHARGRSSDVPVDRDAAHVYRFKGGRIERVEIFGSRTEALEAVGLRE
jgi:ketosteroid isomerase-like protein